MMKHEFELLIASEISVEEFEKANLMYTTFDNLFQDKKSIADFYLNSTPEFYEALYRETLKFSKLLDIRRDLELEVLSLRYSLDKCYIPKSDLFKFVSQYANFKLE